MATGMDDFGIFFSDSLRGEGQGEGDTTLLKRRFREFLKEFRGNDDAYIYRKQLELAVLTKSNSITVELGHISSYDTSLAEQLTKRPGTIFEILEDAAKMVADELTRPRPDNEPINPDLHVQLVSGAEPRTIRDLSANDVGKLVKIPGIAVSATQVRSKASVLSLRCRSCNHTKSNIPVRAGLEGYTLPRKCEAEQTAAREQCPLDPYILVPEMCQCRDFQNIKLQESPDSIPTAEMPRHIGCYMERSLVDQVVPGNRVMITGIFQIKRQQIKGARARDSKKSGGVGTRASYIRCLGVEVEQAGPGRSSAQQKFSREEEDTFKELAARPDIYDLLAKSIAPSIYGCEDIKRSVACLLFGGSRKRLPDGNRRGDINVLMLGDPGTAKSQILKFGERCAPVGVYTSGKGSSAAGLTAAVIRDQNRGFALEAGAMVLADGGLVCIDEFDKMRPEDRVAIHEAMEQQTISIAKAGLTTTLNSRCSVLAAANSVYGRWDDTKGEDNIDFLPTILSRFDMIYVVKDVHDPVRDQKLAQYVMNVHTGENETKEDKDELDLETLKNFINYCRLNCGPRLNGEAAKKLQNQYVLMRQSVAELERSSGKKGAVPITVRQLEAVIRIAESLAKMRLAAFATGRDIDEALRLFKGSTMAAASAGALSGVEGFESASDQEDLNRIERQIKRRFLIGSQVSEKSIVSDLTKQNYPERSVTKVLQIMIRRGEIQQRMQRRMLYRVK